MHELTQTIVDFLASIGIPVREGTVAIDSFLPGLAISHGTLVYDRKTLKWPGDLLHEAGHVATMPASLRALLSDSLEESPAVPHAGEAEATAWAYAAIVHLGMAPSVLFHPAGYHGKSTSLILTYSMGVYPGSFGLAQAGMTLPGAAAASADSPAYPRMTRWLRD